MGEFYEKEDIALPITIGECPDIILFSIDNIDTTTNQFSDLLLLLEKSEVLSESSFILGLIKGLFVGDGLHELWYSVALYYWHGQNDFIDTEKDRT